MTILDKHHIIDDRVNLLDKRTEIKHQFLLIYIPVFLGRKNLGLTSLTEIRPETSIEEIMSVYNKCKPFHILNITKTITFHYNW